MAAEKVPADPEFLSAYNYSNGNQWQGAVGDFQELPQVGAPPNTLPERSIAAAAVFGHGGARGMRALQHRLTQGGMDLHGRGPGPGGRGHFVEAPRPPRGSTAPAIIPTSNAAWRTGRNIIRNANMARTPIGMIASYIGGAALLGASVPALAVDILRLPGSVGRNISRGGSADNPHR